MKPSISIFVKVLILTLVFLFPSRQIAQLSINLSSVTCSSLTASANTGTYTANTFSWSILPVGPIIYSPTSQNTIIRFPKSGNYFLVLMVQTPQGNAQISQSLSVAAVPSLTISASPDTVCWMRESNLSAGGGVNYTWTPSTFLSNIHSSVTISTPSTTITYTLIANNGLGCTNTNTTIIFVGTMPSATIAATALFICPGSTCTLTAFGALKYTWTSSTFTGTIAQQSISVGAGMHCVKVSNGGSCVDSTPATNCITIGLAYCVGMKDYENDEQLFNVYPNPSSDMFFITSENRNITRIEIVDVFGRIVFSENKRLPLNEVLEVDSRTFPNGIYFVKIDFDDRSSRTLKLIKE